MSEPLVIIGCSGHGREIFGIVEAINSGPGGERWKVLGFVDDYPRPGDMARIGRLGSTYLGTTAWLSSVERGTHYALGIGDPQIRATVDRKIDMHNLTPATLVHPDSTVGEDNSFDPGVVIFAGARITTDIRLGRHVHLNQNSTVGHDCVLGGYVSVNPQAAVSGACVIGERALIGAGSVVLQQLEIGPGVTVGAGACVVRDVAADLTVKGVPAK
jgi:sugar O-acyltransferase (sialic acid O-acetyltransferase NeuD family)